MTRHRHIAITTHGRKVINRDIHVYIDKNSCTGCGACVAICPHDTLSLVDGKAAVTGADSLSCGHCLAVCPEDAITVSGFTPTWEGYHGIQPSREAVPPGGFDVNALAGLMTSRRSCRHFKDNPVPIEILEDLVRIGTTAPSGTNAQLWNFTILPDRTSVERVATGVLAFFKKLNKLARMAPLRGALKLIGKPELSGYYESYHDRIEEGIACWEEHKLDRLFHGAPAAIIVSCENEASCGAEDALLASGQILLAAHAMGLATCLVGFAVSAMAKEKTIRSLVNIPDHETVHAVIAVGTPKKRFLRPTVRRSVQPRVVRVA